MHNKEKHHEEKVEEEEDYEAEKEYEENQLESIHRRKRHVESTKHLKAKSDDDVITFTYYITNTYVTQMFNSCK